VYIDLGEYEGALADFSHVLESGDNPIAYSGRGTAYYGLGRYDEAIQDLELSLSLMPGNPHSFCMLAYTYLEVGKYQDSLNAAAKANEINSECGGPKLLTTQARDYYELGNYEQAILYMNQSMETQPIIMGYYYRGKIYQAMGKNDEAIGDLEIFLKQIPPDDEYKDEIADAQARLEELKK
jgi:tetratricopeptide (TPR) repeat protein